VSRPQRLFAVVPAAGLGRRMGGECPKQYLSLGGLPLLHHSVRALLEQARIERVAVALHLADDRAGELPILEDSRILRVTGGTERADSVLAGLQALAEVARDEDWVLVHDAARPCLPQADIERLIERVLARGEGGILALPVVDTLKESDDRGHVRTTVDRERFWRAQTPQMFRLGELREALSRALAAGAPVTDEASAMEGAGYPVQLVEGSATNLKVTVPEDLALAAYYLAAARGRGVRA
jgi:2-C-methyl-D-erythritol 4-phosphate cytidylyltransferase